jgi:hypothetical protein
MIAARQQPRGIFAPARYDRQVYQAAVEALAGSKYPALHRLSCTVSGGVVELSGTVPSFYLKQLAQAAIMQIERVDGVRNLVAVCDESHVLVATGCDQVKNSA